MLHHMIDEAIPGNKIARVFSNTGIEFNAIVKFVKELQAADDRIEIITPLISIKQMLEADGYPFKSKLHSEMVDRYQRSGYDLVSVQKYTAQDGKSGKFSCPKMLLYQFDGPGASFKISQKCCANLKKKPMKEYAKKTGRTMTITGVRSSEGGIREYQASIHGCVFRDKDGSIHKFNPLSPLDDEFMEWYIETRGIKLCELYYPPYDFTRTGCKGCPYNINLAKELDTLADLLPAERRQCEYIWKPVYDEYRRIGYRKMKFKPEPSQGLGVFISSKD